jgi:hypothetical protein
MDWMKLAQLILGTPTALVVAVVAGWKLKSRWDKLATKGELTICQSHETSERQRLSDIIEANSAMAVVACKNLREEIVPKIEKLDDGQTANLTAMGELKGSFGELKARVSDMARAVGI